LNDFLVFVNENDSRMRLKKKINDWRGMILRKFTNLIGPEGEQRVTPGSIEVKKILICRPNHRLGNQLLITPLLTEIERTLPQAKVHLFLKGNLGATVFKNFTCVEAIFELPKKPFSNPWKYLSSWGQIQQNSYDLVLNVVSISGSGRIATRFANARVKSFGIFNHAEKNLPPDSVHLGKAPVYNFRRVLHEIGYETTATSIAPLDLRLNTDERERGKQDLQTVVKNDKKTISIFTFATGAKCYSPEWWSEFYQKIKTAFSEFNIIEILPVEGVSSIDFQAPTYSNKDIRRVASVIAATHLWIGADSGVMHLASASGALTAGLFSVTEPANLAPYNGDSRALDTRHLSIDDCIEELKRMV
jgi:ADP-heptose:LPS heptosyltransferase